MMPSGPTLRTRLATQSAIRTPPSGCTSTPSGHSSRAAVAGPPSPEDAGLPARPATSAGGRPGATRQTADGTRRPGPPKKSHVATNSVPSGAKARSRSSSLAVGTGTRERTPRSTQNTLPPTRVPKAITPSGLTARAVGTFGIAMSTARAPARPGASPSPSRMYDGSAPAGATATQPARRKTAATTSRPAQPRRPR